MSVFKKFRLKFTIAAILLIFSLTDTVGIIFALESMIDSIFLSITLFAIIVIYCTYASAVMDMSIENDKFYNRKPIQLSFKKFKTFYTINPSHYKLLFHYAYYTAQTPKFKIYFSFIDWIRYNFWRYRNSISTTSLDHSNDVSEYLKFVQEDIEMELSKSTEYMFTATEIIDHVMKGEK